MPPDPLTDPGSALRTAARGPREPVDPAAVLSRAGTLRRRRAVLSGVAGAALLAPLVALALARPDGAVEFADRDLLRGEAVPARLPAAERPPARLADGGPPAAVPEAVAGRFGEPVVAVRESGSLATVPPGACTSTPLSRDGEPRAAALAGRLDALAAAAAPAGTAIGPRFAAALAVGGAATPPGYPDAYAATCLLHHSGGAWHTEGLSVQHLYQGWTGYSTAGGDGRADVAWVTAFEVPEGAAWAVQEQPGWWLAHPVTGRDWMLAQTSASAPAGGATPDGVAFPGARTVFLDAAGRVLADEHVAEAIGPDAPFARSQAVAATLDVGRLGQVRARLAEGPLASCDAGVAVCVWLTEAGGEILALAAAGPHPADVPPLGAVGWCPAGGVFEATATGSVFDAVGAWVAGPAPSGLHRYDVVTAGGRVIVDLSRFSFGPDRPDASGPAPEGCGDLVEPG